MTRSRLVAGLMLCAVRLAAFPEWDGGPVRLVSAIEFVDIDKADMRTPAFATGVTMRPAVDAAVPAEAWRLAVYSFSRGLVQEFTGQGRPPGSIRWYGVTKTGGLAGNSFYVAELEVRAQGGRTLRSPDVSISLIKPVELGQLEDYDLSFFEDAGKIVIRLPKLTFSPGSSAISPEVHETLDAVVRLLEGIQDKRILVLGFTDPTGSPGRNRMISQARARGVYDYLVCRGGFTWTRMRFGGMGDSRPIADNSTAEGRERNRRVEIWMQKA